ncbi:MAG: (2Fe-2S)-binding protein [Eggerthellaceae bacterium]
MTTPTYRHYGAEPFKPEADDDLIVCRCEEVTKGDIRQAVHQGLYRFPEIRRFERCGMGLCQGRTCTKLIQSIVSKELQLSYEELRHPAARSPQRPLQMQELGNEKIEELS